MNFFQEIFDIADGINLSMTIARAADKLSITVLPATSQKLQPLVATGTPDELAEGFTAAITTPLKEAIGLMTNAEQFKKAAEEAAGAIKKEAEVKPAPAKKEKPVKAAKSKPVKEKLKKEKPAKPAKSKLEEKTEEPQPEDEPTLF